jgi:hypothetical protein
MIVAQDRGQFGIILSVGNYELLIKVEGFLRGKMLENVKTDRNFFNDWRQNDSKKGRKKPSPSYY